MLSELAQSGVCVVPEGAILLNEPHFRDGLFDMVMRFLLLLVALLALTSAQQAQAQKKATKGVHNNRRIDEKVAKMDANTRKRVLAMKNAGIPNDAIAKKISYEAGNEGTARRMLEKINKDEDKKRWAHQQKQKAHVKNTVKTSKKAKKKTRA